MSDVKDKAAEKAAEPVTLERSELWLLRVAAATGVLGMISHGLDLLHEIGLF